MKLKLTVDDHWHLFQMVVRMVLTKEYETMHFLYQYQIEITDRFAALENVSEDEDINRGWESIKENIKTPATERLGMHEMKQHKPWFDEECLGILEQRKQAKIQWIQDPSQSNVDNLNNVRRDASRHFRNKKKA